MFAPGVEEIYPPGFDTAVSVGAVAQPLEGAARPGHFDGVATVVAILFNLVGAERAYFGQKDAQQVMVIRQMARDLAIGDGGARLPDGPRGGRPRAVVAQRPSHAGATRAAAVLRRALLAARAPGRPASVRATRSAPRCVPMLDGEPLAAIEYVSVADGATLAELHTVDGPALASLAVRFGTTRLIDNEPLG